MMMKFKLYWRATSRSCRERCRANFLRCLLAVFNVFKVVDEVVDGVVVVEVVDEVYSEKGKV